MFSRLHAASPSDVASTHKRRQPRSVQAEAVVRCSSTTVAAMITARIGLALRLVPYRYSGTMMLELDEAPTSGGVPRTRLRWEYISRKL